jgi:dipeptidyl aminopeptidase/acylaminoacyl peptidase
MPGRSSISLISILALLIFAGSPGSSVALETSGQRAVTIEDCIRMVHIQQTYDADDPTVVFSPDGRRFVTMVWHGNLATNLNDHTILVFDAEHLDHKPTELTHVGFTYEEDEQHARPLKQFAFLTNNRLAALATFHGEPRQVVTIDLATKAVTPLTSYPGGILSFAAAPDGGALVFGVAAPADEGRKAALYRDGFSLEDPDAIDPVTMPQVALGNWFSPRVEYFIVAGPSAQPRKIFEGSGARGAPTFWMSPDGRKAVVYPFAESAKAPQTFGLIDMSSGKIERLIPGDTPSAGRILWARDSQSLIVAPPPFGSGPAVLYEVNASSRKMTSRNIGQGTQWNLLGWTASGDGLILTRGGYPRSGDPEGTLAVIHRTTDGWAEPAVVTRAESRFGLNARYFSGTNGRLIVGVNDGLAEPPEIAAYDLDSKQTRNLTHLNPQLGELKLGEVSRIRWSGPFDKDTSFGYLIKPVGYVPGEKYPLIIQFKDEGYYPEDNSYILDGAEQYSGAAIQVWANEGFMVLFTPSPLSVREAIETPKEDERITAHIDTALDLLESQGLIDRTKVGISGWSRSGWWTEYVVTHARTRFAAASNIDNVEYNMQRYALSYPTEPSYVVNHWAKVLPWGEGSKAWPEQAIDLKYADAQTPRLIEVHGMHFGGVVWHAELYAALKTAKIPVDFYLFPDGPHNLKSPVHRLHSLSAHNDWFRFWLQDYEDPSAGKQAQYIRWRKMRDEWKEAGRAAAAKPGAKQ